MHTPRSSRVDDLFVLSAILVGAGSLAGCAMVGTTVEPGSMALKNVVLSEPALQEEVRPEGFYFQWPWNEMVAYNVTLQSRDEDVQILTGDDLHVATTATVTFRPKRKELRRLHTELGPSYYLEVIRPLFVTLVRSEFSEHKHNDLARHSPIIEAAVADKLRAALASMPVEITAVAIKHIMYDRTVTEAISRKLATEQAAEEKRHELVIAERDAEIARRTAKGRADSIRILAEGEAQAIVLRGDAQAKAQKSINGTLSAQYLQYKAFDGESTRYYFVPIGKDGLPLIIDAGGGAENGASGPAK